MNIYELHLPAAILPWDAKVNATLCSNAWHIVNSQDIRTTLLFEKGGEVILSLKGDASTGSWRYRKSRQAIEIEMDGEVWTFDICYLDDSQAVLRANDTDWGLRLFSPALIEQGITTEEQGNDLIRKPEKPRRKRRPSAYDLEIQRIKDESQPLTDYLKADSIYESRRRHLDIALIALCVVGFGLFVAYLFVKDTDYHLIYAAIMAPVMIWVMVAAIMKDARRNKLEREYSRPVS